MLTTAQAARDQELAEGATLERQDLDAAHAPTAATSSLGYAVIDVRTVRTLPEALLIVIAPDGSVRSLRVLAFHEPTEYQPSERWLAQMDGKRLGPELHLKRDDPRDRRRHAVLAGRDAQRAHRPRAISGPAWKRRRRRVAGAALALRVTGEMNRNRLLQTIVVLYSLYVACSGSRTPCSTSRSMSLTTVLGGRLTTSARRSSFREPRSYAGMLEVSHFHLFAMGMLLLVLTHLVLFVPIANRTKAWLIALPFRRRCSTRARAGSCASSRRASRG